MCFDLKKMFKEIFYKSFKKKFKFLSENFVRIFFFLVFYRFIF